STHELWVTETLSETIDHVKLAHQTTVSALIDAAVEKCDLEGWQGWTSFALSPNQRWTKDRPEALWEFREKVIAAIWPPGFDELRRAMTTLSILAHRAAQEFMENSQLSGDVYIADKFYRRPAYNPNYKEDLKKFEDWQTRCYKLLKDATKAA